MSGSSGCRLDLPYGFGALLTTFENENYGKHEAKGKAEARLLIEAIIGGLLEWPNVAKSHPEPFPSTIGGETTKAGWLLYKVEFQTPRLTGSAKCGRLIYLVQKDERLVMPIVVYTHKQFPGRVPDKNLAALIEQATAAKKSVADTKVKLVDPARQGAASAQSASTKSPDSAVALPQTRAAQTDPDTE